MTLPIGENTESLYVAKLIEITVVAPLETIFDGLVDLSAIFVPENRPVASGIFCVAELEVEVSPACFPRDFVLVDGERRTVVEVTLKPDQVTEAIVYDGERSSRIVRAVYLRCHCIVEQHIHATFVDLTNGSLPHGYVAKMLV